jgi:hypothetical protein
MTPVSGIQKNGFGRAPTQTVQYRGRCQVEAGRKVSQVTHDFTVLGDVEGRGGHRSL